MADPEILILFATTRRDEDAHASWASGGTPSVTSP
jgi:hypothetical protein